MADDLIQSVAPTEPGQRPVIAILKARAGMEARLRSLLVDLVKETRQEPGCVQFLLYEASDSPGTYYLYEVYLDGAAFLEHLKGDTVAKFKAALPAVSDSDQAKDLTQLLEVSI